MIVKRDVSRTPVTINGRCLNDMPRLHIADCPKALRQEPCDCNVAGDIFAIEQEAAALERRKTVERIRNELGPPADDSYTTIYVNDVHAILDALASESEPQR